MQCFMPQMLPIQTKKKVPQQSRFLLHFSRNTYLSAKIQNSFYNDKKIIVVHLNSSDFVIDFRHTMCYSFIAFKST